LKNFAVFKGDSVLMTLDNYVDHGREIITFVVHLALTSPAEA